VLKHKKKECPVCGFRFKVAFNKASRHFPKSTQVFCSLECARKGRYRRGSVCKKLSEVDAAYIAGFVDGEGSIMLINRKSVALRLTIAQSEKSVDVLDWIGEVTGVGARIMKKAASPNHDNGWTWICNSDAAESVISQLLPYLRVKHLQAKIAIGFQRKIRNPHEKSCMDWQKSEQTKIKTLNKRGKLEFTYQLTTNSGG